MARRCRSGFRENSVSFRLSRPTSRSRGGSWRPAGLIAVALALDTSVASAQTVSDTVRLTLTQARSLAGQANPELLAARLDTAVARGELRQAGILPFNPSADVLGAAGGNGGEAGLTQELELFGQRRARLRVGRAGVERAAATIANATRLTVAEVDRSFYRLASAARRRALAEEVLILNERLQYIAQRQLSAGEISRLELNLAIVELGRSRARSLAARREQEQLSIELLRALGRPQGTPIVAQLDSTSPRSTPADTGRAGGVAPSAGTAGASLNVDSLTALALARRPDLAAGQAAVQQAQASVALARREALPNLIARAAIEPRADGGGQVVRPGIGITLPFLNRNQGVVQARRAAARQAELTRAALVARVRSEVATAVQAYESAASEVQTLESTVLVPARQNRQLVEIAFREGKVGLPELLLIRNQASDAELEYWAAWLAEREALATLAESTGENLTPQSRGTTP